MGYEFWPTIKYILDYFLKKKKKKLKILFSYQNFIQS